MAASKDDLSNIHAKLAKFYLALLDVFERGGACEHCGAINKGFANANPAIFGHINKFLAENDIQAVAVPGTPLDRLQSKGKVIQLPVFDEHERFAAGE